MNRELSGYRRHLTSCEWTRAPWVKAYRRGKEVVKHLQHEGMPKVRHITEKKELRGEPEAHGVTEAKEGRCFKRSG